MKKKTSTDAKNLSMAIFFICAVCLLIFAGFLWKLFGLISQSTVDSKHQYVLEVIKNDPTMFIVLSPEIESISLLNIEGNRQNTKIAPTLEVPVDAQFNGPVGDSIASFLWGNIFHTKANINVIDRIKLWWYGKSVPASSISSDTISLPVDPTIDDKVITKIFLDKSLYEEGQTIKIINASDVSGLGGRVAKLLTNIGANVVDVSTADTSEDTSLIIYNGQNSYTLQRLERILHILPSISQNKSDIADIIITIGKDKANTILF